MSKRWKEVARILMSCRDHTRDTDWMENDTKQFCEKLGCRVPLCPRCGYNITINSDGVLYGYCEKHAKS